MTLDGNVIHDFILWGFNAKKASEIVINNNVINGIKPANEPDPPYMVWVPVIGAVNLESSKDFVVTNNIAASSWHVGFMLPAYKCGGT